MQSFHFTSSLQKQKTFTLSIPKGQEPIKLRSTPKKQKVVRIFRRVTPTQIIDIELEVSFFISQIVRVVEFIGIVVIINT